MRLGRLAIFLAALFGFVFSARARTIVVRPAEIHDVLTNPGMGIQTFQRFNGDTLNSGVEWSEEGPVSPLTASAQKPDFPDSTVAYCRWHWATLEPTQGNARWEIIDSALERPGVTDSG